MQTTQSSLFSSQTLTENNSLNYGTDLIDPITSLNESLVTTYRSASSIPTSTSSTKTTNILASLVNPDGTYTVAGWTWDPKNAVTNGSVITEDSNSNLSTFPSAFLGSQGEPLAQQTVGNILFDQPNNSVTLGTDDVTRAGIELTWGGNGLPNDVGNDFVVYENGNIGASEGYAVAVRLAGSETFTRFRYEFYDTFESEIPTNPNAGVLATAFDLSDFGIALGQSIDAIQIINLQSSDLVDGDGEGFLSNSGTSPLDPTTGEPFTSDRLDPDITFVAGLRTVEEVEPFRFNIVGTGDFNGDSQTDILFRNRGTGQNVVWLMEGTELLSVAELASVEDPNWDIKQTGDFNADGNVDIVWRNGASGENIIWLMDGTTLIEGVEITPVSNLNWDIRGTGDFSGDGQPDLLWRNRATGDNVIWEMNGTNFVEGVYTNPVEDPAWNIGGTGDFNGDGRVDIVWRNQTTGENALLLMAGISPAQETLFIDQWDDLNWDIRSAGDLNSDGQPDILWQNQATDEIVAWLMDGTELAGVSPIPSA
jgi:hypothetical protein